MDQVERRENIRCWMDSTVEELLTRDGRLTGLRVRDGAAGEERELDVDALFVAVGQEPRNRALTDLLLERASDIYARKEAELGEPLMRELERVMMLRVVDEYWMDNIDAMQELRQGIGLRAYGQNDPVVAYKKEGYEMFESMIAAIQAETIRRIFLARVQVGATTVKRERVAKVTGESAGSDGTVKKQPVKKGQKVGRNDPCPCGSGKKYKKCCGMHEDE